MQISVTLQFSSILPIDRTLSGATTHDKHRRGSDGNEEVLCIPQRSSITGASPSVCSVSYPEHVWWVLPLSWDAAGVFYSPNRLGHCLSNWMLLISSRVRTTIWLHLMAFEEKSGKRAKWALHKDITSSSEQILEANSSKQQLYQHLLHILKTLQWDEQNILATSK